MSVDRDPYTVRSVLVGLFTLALLAGCVVFYVWLWTVTR